MNFIVVCILHILLMVVTMIFIETKWRKYTADWLFGAGSLRRYNVLSAVWPTDDGFASLKWSAARHCIIPLIFSALICFVNSAWVTRISMFLTLLYVWPVISRYRVRLADYKTAGDSSKNMLKPVKSACFSIVVCSVLNFLVVVFTYAISGT